LHFAFCAWRFALFTFLYTGRLKYFDQTLFPRIKSSGKQKPTKKFKRGNQKIMSLKRRILTGITSGFALVALGSFAMAQDNKTVTPNQDNQKSERKWEKRGDGQERGGRFGRGGRRGGFGLHGLRELNLTDAQKEQIRTIMESKRGNREAGQTQREELRQIVEARRNGTLTAEQEARLKAFRDQRRAEMRQTHEQILAILTPEQRTQLEQLKQERQNRRQEFRRNRRNKTTNETPQDN
jgi:protein CpxP